MAQQRIDQELILMGKNVNFEIICIEIEVLRLKYKNKNLNDDKNNCSHCKSERKKKIIGKIHQIWTYELFELLISNYKHQTETKE